VQTTATGSADLALTAASLDETRVETGHPVEATARLRNLGDRAGRFEVALGVDGRVVASKPLSLDANQSAAVAFEHAFDETGLYTVTVASERVGNVTVLESTGGESRVDVVETRLPADWVKRGYDATVLTTVVNPGDRPATETLAVTLDGDQVATRTVELSPDTRRTLRIEFPARQGTIAIDGVRAGQLNVSDTWGAEEPTARPTEASGPGFGFALLVPLFVSLLLVFGLGWFRRW